MAKSKPKTGNIEITREEYEEFRAIQQAHTALHVGGVSGWSGYEAAMADIFNAQYVESLIEEATETLLYELSEHIDAPAGREAGYSICGDEPFEIVNKFIARVEEIKRENWDGN